MTCRIVLDEDVPIDLAEHLRARGTAAEAVAEMRQRVWPGKRSISDDDVCREVASSPSVLVTQNIRDYADVAFIERLVAEHRISVVIVRVPKREKRKTREPQAIRDIVHRHAHRIDRLCEGEPVVVSASRRGFRKRSLSEVVVRQNV